MDKIIMRFNDEKNKRNGASSYINFIRAIKGLKFSERTIRNSFDKLVDKTDYLPDEKRSVVNYVLSAIK